MLSRGRLRFGQASVSALRVGLAYARVRGREGLRETLLECLHFPHPPLLEEAAERASGFGRLREADASTRRNVQAMGHEQRLGSMERLGQSIGAAVDEVVYLDTHSLDDDELGHRQAIRTRQPYRRCYWHHGRLVHANQLRRFQASSIENQAFPIHFPRSKPFLGLQVDSDVPSSFNLSASKTNTHIVRCHRFFFLPPRQVDIRIMSAPTFASRAALRGFVPPAARNADAPIPWFPDASADAAAATAAGSTTGPTYSAPISASSAIRQGDTPN